MSVHSVYAIIADGRVQERLVGDLEACTEAGRALHGEGAIAVDVSEIPVRGGDIYRGGMFYREHDGDEEPVRKAENFEDAVMSIREELRAVRAYADLIGMAVTDTAEMAGVTGVAE